MNKHTRLFSSAFVALIVLFILSGCQPQEVLVIDARTDLVRSRDYAPEFKEAIINREVVEDMTKEMVLFSWGEPTHTKTKKLWAYETGTGYDETLRIVFFDEDERVTRVDRMRRRSQ